MIPAPKAERVCNPRPKYFSPRLAGKFTHQASVLQVLTGTEITSAINIKAETDGDNEIGLAEVIYIMQKLSEFGR